MSVLIERAEELTTPVLLGKVLNLLNVDERAKFYVSPGKGRDTVQCLRMRLSRVRASMEAKRIAYKRFILHSDIFACTMLDGSRRDCIVLWRKRTSDHDILETLQGLIPDGASIRLD